MCQYSTFCVLIIAFSIKESSRFSPPWHLLLTAFSQSKSSDCTLTLNRVNSGIVMLPSFTLIRIISCLGLKSVLLMKYDSQMMRPSF